MKTCDCLLRLLIDCLSKAFSLVRVSVTVHLIRRTNKKRGWDSCTFYYRAKKKSAMTTYHPQWIPCNTHIVWKAKTKTKAKNKTKQTKLFDRNIRTACPNIKCFNLPKYFVRLVRFGRFYWLYRPLLGVWEYKHIYNRLQGQNSFSRRYLTQRIRWKISVISSPNIFNTGGIGL